MKKILCIYVAILLLAMPGVVAQVDGGLTRSGEVSTYDGTRADFLTVAGKLSRYPQLAKSGEELHYAPVVTTDSVNVDLSNVVNVFGNILFNGWYETVTAQGFQLSISSGFESSTVTEYPVTPGSPYVECDQPCSANVFTLNITDLTPNIPYYVRAYATNAEGTTYGEALPVIIYGGEGCPGTPTVTDADGNEYETVLIGTQCWTKTNLRVAPVGATDATSSGASSETEPYYYVNSSVDAATYGYYYNWEAAKLACPAGWHLPSDAEWNTLEATVSGSDWQESYVTAIAYRGSHAGKLAGDGWNSSSTAGAPGNAADTNHNASGFGAVPASGWINGFGSAGLNAFFWSSTEYGTNIAWNRGLGYSHAGVYRGNGHSRYVGFSVRCLRDETGGGTTYVQPTVTTSAPTDITSTSATLNGSVSNPDNVTITAQGFEWKTTMGGTYAAVNATGETMTYNLTGLAVGTFYTYRAFVTTAAGTSYGSEVSFTTLAAGGGAVEGDAIPCPNTPTVTDHEGNVYATVQIGNQCWMRDNLRTTTSPSTGTYLIPAANANYTCTGKQARWYNNDSVTYAPMNYGLLYNWNAAVDTFNTAYGETSVNTSSSNAVSVTFNGHRRGICPAGWHLPSDAEWTQLENYVGSQSEYTCGGNSNNIAKALASTEGWNSYSGECYPGDQSVTANNATGFSAVPAGYCDGSSFYYSAGLIAIFLSATPSASLAAYNRGLYYNGACVNGDDGEGNGGRSVRCLRDETGGGTALTEPTVTTSGATDVTETSATLNGSVSNPDNVAITAQGFEWKATSGGAYVAVNATGETMTYNLTGLTAGTSYTYRAFVTTAAGTSYGDEVAFTTTASGSASFTCGTSKMVDADGNEYETVQVGTQCWTKTNLRSTKAADGSAIPAGSATSNTEPYYYDYSSHSLPLEKRGYLYNWPAANEVCPSGWHLPSDAEWTTLTDYVSSQSEFQCGGNSNYIAKALASTEGWNSYSGECYPGDQSVTANNATGFSAVPAGLCFGSSFDTAGHIADFWSSTQNASGNAYDRYLSYDDAGVHGGSFDKYIGSSVRCLRD